MHKISNQINFLKLFYKFSDLDQHQYQYVPQVHEFENTYTVPARQSLVKPVIGGGAPIQSLLIPQPQYIYVTASGNHGSHASAVKTASVPVATAAIAPPAAKTLYQQEQQSQHHVYSPLYAPPQPSAHEQ